MKRRNPRRACEPRIDVIETDNEITVSAELPGLEAKDSEGSLMPGSLVLRGERRGEPEAKGAIQPRGDHSVGALRGRSRTGMPRSGGSVRLSVDPRRA